MVDHNHIPKNWAAGLLVLLGEAAFGPDGFRCGPGSGIWLDGQVLPSAVGFRGLLIK